MHTGFVICNSSAIRNCLHITKGINTVCNTISIVYRAVPFKIIFTCGNRTGTSVCFLGSKINVKRNFSGSLLAILKSYYLIGIAYNRFTSILRTTRCKFDSGNRIFKVKRTSVTRNSIIHTVKAKFQLTERSVCAKVTVPLASHFT